MASDKKTLEFIVKLTRLTLEGDITWQMSDDTASIVKGTNSIIPILYITKLKEKIFGIYQIRELDVNYEAEYNRRIWQENLVLAQLDSENKVLWENYGQLPALRNLFEAVRAQASGINDFIDDILLGDKYNSNRNESLTV